MRKKTLSLNIDFYNWDKIQFPYLVTNLKLLLNIVFDDVIHSPPSKKIPTSPLVGRTAAWIENDCICHRYHIDMLSGSCCHKYAWYNCKGRVFFQQRNWIYLFNFKGAGISSSRCLIPSHGFKPQYPQQSTSRNPTERCLHHYLFIHVM